METPSRPGSERLLSSSQDRISPNRDWAFARTALWAACYFAFYFVQQIAELLAPLLLVIGIGWGALPHVMQAVTVGAAGADPQARDVMAHVASAIPTQMTIAGHLLSPSSLIFDGFMLMALAAAGATLAAVSARNM
ncbi:hypothetical protein [Brytella acorum]|uniref:Uncharacterized protein n=1 Tax=Brytella acorum TaxID=2959299 RepID=A0AA35VD78_9PROT|nr:hypothetical protein [Brytella acorum]MDF3624268.1 hypothetical protein [Brytella acorum]CAI9121158.1 hypothetical protein LMG32879_002004 [Brytella acorum]